jgi:DNA-binding MarR family transcriptional regulator
MDNQRLLFGTLFSLSNKLQTTGDLFFGEITAKQWFLIACIGIMEPEKPTLTNLEKYVGSSRQNIKQLALKLEEKGFLSIKQDPDDSRSLLLEITERAKEFFSARNNDSSDFLNALFEGIPESDIATTLKVLRLMESATEKVHKEYV